MDQALMLFRMERKLKSRKVTTPECNDRPVLPEDVDLHSGSAISWFRRSAGVGFRTGVPNWLQPCPCLDLSPLSSRYGTYEKVNAGFWRWLSGKVPYSHSRCSLFARQRQGRAANLPPCRKNVLLKEPEANKGTVVVTKCGKSPSSGSSPWDRTM